MRKDINLNFKPHPLTGDLAMVTKERAIIQSMKNLIFTNFYERGFNVVVAGNVRANLFEVITPAVRNAIQRDVEMVLKNFEPSVEVIRVVVKEPENNSNAVVVTIVYNIYNDPVERFLEIPLERVK